MADFKQLISLYTDYIFLNCDIEIIKGDLLINSNNGDIIAQLLFNNLSTKFLKSFYIEIEQYDEKGTILNEGERVKFAYLNLNMEKNHTFGDNTFILLNNKQTRKIKIYIIKYTVDNEVIEMAENNILDYGNHLKECIVLPEIKIKEFESKYTNLVTTQKKIYYPKIFDNGWLCSCGRFNCDKGKCRRCGLDIQVQVSLMAPVEFDNIYINKQENMSKQKIINQEDICNPICYFPDKVKKKNIKKASIIISIAVIIVLGLVFVQYVYPYVIRPAVDYNKAEALMNAEWYTDAQSAFLKLGTYKDSFDRATQAHEKYLEYLYNQAILAAERGLYQISYDFYSLLVDIDYKDSKAQQEEVYKHIYRVEEENITLTVGCCLNTTLIYYVGRTLTKDVDAVVSVVYKNDIPDLDNVIVEFLSPSWSGTMNGWYNLRCKYVGKYSDIENGTITGEGVLYKHRLDYDIVLYKGEFKNGQYDGGGVLYDEDYLEKKYLVGIFQEGNVVGHYTTYYSDESVSDTGTVTKDGQVSSSKYGDMDYKKITSSCLDYLDE